MDGGRQLLLLLLSCLAANLYSVATRQAPTQKSAALQLLLLLLLPCLAAKIYSVATRQAPTQKTAALQLQQQQQQRSPLAFLCNGVQLDPLGVDVVRRVISYASENRLQRSRKESLKNGAVYIRNSHSLVITAEQRCSYSIKLETAD